VLSIDPVLLSNLTTACSAGKAISQLHSDSAPTCIDVGGGGASGVSSITTGRGIAASGSTGNVFLSLVIPMSLTYDNGDGTFAPVVSASGTNGSGGIAGFSDSGAAVSGTSTSGTAVFGTSTQNDALVGTSHASSHSGVLGQGAGGAAGVTGSSSGFNGVVGTTSATDMNGVYGDSTGLGTGVYGHTSSPNSTPASNDLAAVVGDNTSTNSAAIGVQGRTSSGTGVYGLGGFGVVGDATASTGTGVRGVGAYGVVGESSLDSNGPGVTGTAGGNGPGVAGISAGTGPGVQGTANGPGYGLAGYLLSSSGTAGILAQGGGGSTLAGSFEGNVRISPAFGQTGDLSVSGTASFGHIAVQPPQPLLVLPSNGFTNPSAGESPPTYWKDPMGVVHLSGRIVSTQTASDGDAASLPTGYWPTYDQAVPAWQFTSGITLVEITHTGQIIVLNPQTNGEISLDGITFLAQ
jgi:hypothetical protein